MLRAEEGSSFPEKKWRPVKDRPFKSSVQPTRWPRRKSAGHREAAQKLLTGGLAAHRERANSWRSTQKQTLRRAREAKGRGERKQLFSSGRNRDKQVTMKDTSRLY